MERIARYSGLKNRSRQVQQYLQGISDSDKQASRLSFDLKTCANYLLFHDYYTADQIRLVKARTCKKSLLCPFCAARRAAKLVDKYLPVVDSVIASNPALKPVMITLTVKNGSDLGERYRHLKSAYTALQQRRRDYLKGQLWTEFAKVHGAIHSFEFTRSDTGWHPHIHMVALVSDWIDQKALASEWQALTGDSYIVDVRRISTQDGSLALGMLEVFKYSLKFSDLDLPDTWLAYQVLNRKRLLGSFGNLRGVQPPENLLDDPLEDLPYMELLYTFRPASAAYELKTIRRCDAGEAVDCTTGEVSPLPPVYPIPDPPRAHTFPAAGERIGARAPCRR